MRILFNCPDHHVPSGGVKQLYRYAWLLSRRGYEAAIVHTTPGFRVSWHGVDAPVLHADASLIKSLTPKDIVVFNEIDAPVGLQRVPDDCVRVVWAGSWSYIYPALAAHPTPAESWNDLGVNAVLTPSQTVASFIDWSMGLSAEVIPPSIDPTHFYLGDTRTKKKQIAYIQRKAEFAPWLETITRSRRSAISEYEWIGMVDCSEEEYAQRLRESMIYLVCGSQEGLNLSAIEAMASGCIVLGFSGVGGKDYMVGSGDRQNAVLVEGNDYFALGREIENVTTALEKNPDAYADLVRNALETASRFSDPEKESASLEGFFQNLGAQMASSD